MEDKFMERCFCGAPLVAWSTDRAFVVVHQYLRKEFDLMEFGKDDMVVANWLAETVHGDAHNAISPVEQAGLAHRVIYRYTNIHNGNGELSETASESRTYYSIS